MGHFYLFKNDQLPAGAPQPEVTTAELRLAAVAVRAAQKACCVARPRVVPRIVIRALSAQYSLSDTRANSRRETSSVKPASTQIQSEKKRKRKRLLLLIFTD